MTITEVERETGWEKQGGTWLPPRPLERHSHEASDIRLDGIWDPGDIKWSARVNPAPGWLKCDASLRPRATYARLFEAIGFSYSPVPGADPGGGMFYLPPPGRMPVGLDSAQVEFDTLGKTGGSKTSTAPHTHGLSTHTHGFAHTHGMNSVDTNHAHNVYARNQNTGGISANHTHVSPWSSGGGNIGLTPGGSNYNLTPRDVNTGIVSSDHSHNFNHDHPSTNYQSESPWAGTWNHAHTTNSQSTSTTGGPSNDTSGASSAAATSGNLPPYVVFNCFIKT